MNDLRIIENDLVPVYETDKGIKVVNGRELHQVLQSGQDFSTWVKKRLTECDAEENKDYDRLHKKMEANNATMIEYIIKLDTAKEMAMLERNDKGKQVRKYFIAVEEKYKQGVVDRSQLSPQLQSLYGLIETQARQELEQKRIAEEQKKQSEQIQKVEDTVTTIKEILTEPIGDWKAEINSRVREISIKSGVDYQTLYGQLYGELETTAHCSLKRLQDNKKARMEKAGNTKTAIKDATTKIAIIFEKPQLKAIFESIVKRYAMKYCA